ncbi:uncharacterized protein [Asterias amurensis]|uniref:uncharacterized protein n=1 Tax=Asterias amurensis TaxID=7602 RepID=UPI003AB1B66E
MGMHTSWVKTKIQNCTSLGPNPASVTVEGNSVEFTQKFRHLGCDIHSSGYSSPDILRRLGLASSTFSQLDRVWRNKRLKLRVFTTCVLPVLLYGSGTWTLRADDTRKLQAFSLRCQRRILGVRWSDFITNATISETTGIEDIRVTISRRCHSLFGTRHTYPCGPQAERPCPAWKRPRGRPRSTWVGQLEADFESRAGQLWHSAAERIGWAALLRPP